MANYHDNIWISQKMEEHLQEAKETLKDRPIVVLACQGSQNYGLDYEDSDFDTKCITAPTFKEIALNRKALSTTHIRENNEHIDLKDIRLYVQTFRKQNLNFLEILFTNYYICPLNAFTNFYDEWGRLMNNREKIAHMNPARGLASMKGIAAEKYHALEHHYLSRMGWINKYGYDPKQLHHLLRIEEFMQRFWQGESFEDCLISKMPEYLIAVKRGYYVLEDARYEANAAMRKIENLYNQAKETMNNKEDQEAVELLEDVSYNIMKRSIQNELGGIYI